MSRKGVSVSGETYEYLKSLLGRQGDLRTHRQGQATLTDVVAAMVDHPRLTAAQIVKAKLHLKKARSL